MSDPSGQPGIPEGDRCERTAEDACSQGPSLRLLYSLIAVALIAAIGFALLIVLPFYHRR